MTKPIKDVFDLLPAKQGAALKQKVAAGSGLAAWDVYQNQPEELAQRVELLAQHPKSAHLYALQELKKPWHQASGIDPATASQAHQSIASDGEWAYWYAYWVLRNPWHRAPGITADTARQAHWSIASDGEWAYLYARHVLDQPWHQVKEIDAATAHQAHQSIASSDERARWYAKNFGLDYDAANRSFSAKKIKESATDKHDIKVGSRIRTLKMGQMEGVVTGFKQSNHENGKTYATVPSNVEVLESSLPEQALEEHIKRGVPLIDSIFRPGSQAFFEVFAHAKKLQANGTLPKMDPVSQELLKTDIGTWATYQGQRVPLDWPMENLTEAKYRGKKVDLNKPKRGGSKAYYVYVRNPDTGNVIKVEFGSGMRAKIDDPEARKRYDNRHGCSKGRHNDKTKAGYWSCRLPKYSKSLGLSGSGQWW